MTGGASGIGRATVHRLAAEGASVIVADIDAGGAARVAAEVGGTARPLDVAAPADWSRLADELGAGAADGGVDIAVLCAGVVTGEDRIGRARRCRLPADPRGQRRRRRVRDAGGGAADGPPWGGAIVAISSLAGLIPYPPDPIYSLTKHAVVGFVRSVAAQLERDGITVNAVCPGITDTPLLSGVMRRQVEEAGFPVMAPDQVAAAVLEAVLGRETGRALVCQPGREADGLPLLQRARAGGEGGAASGRRRPAHGPGRSPDGQEAR